MEYSIHIKGPFLSLFVFSIRAVATLEVQFKLFQFSLLF